MRAWSAFWLACLAIGCWVGDPGSVRAQESPAGPTPPGNVEPSTGSVPPAPPKRDDYINAPGAPRPPIKGFRDTKSVSFPEPTGKKLDDLLKGTAKDDAAIDAFAKSQTARLTLKGNEADRQIIVQIKRTFDSRNSYDEESVRKYKQSIYKHLGSLLDNSVVVQVNVLHVASTIQNGFADVADGVPLFLTVLKDPAREDAVKHMALVGLIQAKERNLVRAADEGEASAAILAELAKADLQSVLEAKLYETLGVLGRAYGQRPGDVQVASALASAILQPTKTLDVRVEAGKALAKMSLSEVKDWNAKLQAQLVARALRDWVEGSSEVQGRGVDARKYGAYLWWKALAKGLEQPPNQASSEFKDFADSVANRNVLLPLLRGESAGAEEIDQWLEKNPVGDPKRLAPRGAELMFPPRETPTASSR